MIFFSIDLWRFNLLILYQWLCFTHWFAPIGDNKMN